MVLVGVAIFLKKNGKIREFIMMFLSTIISTHHPA